MTFAVEAAAFGTIFLGVVAAFDLVTGAFLGITFGVSTLDGATSTLLFGGSYWAFFAWGACTFVEAGGGTFTPEGITFLAGDLALVSVAALGVTYFASVGATFIAAVF